MKVLGWIIAVIAVILLAVVHQILKRKGISKREERFFLLGYDLGCFSCFLLLLAWFLIS